MASRQLRKLRKQQELLGPQKDAAEESDGSDDDFVPAAKPRANIFSSFAALGDEGNNDDDDEQSDQEEASRPEVAQEADTPAKKSKKSKKKKKKAKKAEASASANDGKDSLDDIDRALEELSLQNPQQGPEVVRGPVILHGIPPRDLLQINFHNLKAMREMRRLFGRAMDSANAEETAEEPRAARGARQEVDLEAYLSARASFAGPGQSSKHAMFDTVLRTNPFIEGKKTWPRGSANGLIMKALKNEDLDPQVTEFTYSHEKEYIKLEGEFFHLVQMYDPMQIVHFLYLHPYHISSLIQVSKVAKQDQNSALAADLIERALFTFGRLGLKDFRTKLGQGRVYMDFARPENRQFYLAGWNLIQHLILKGACRTALEWAKLFLSINHGDPYAMINWVHVLAIRAYEAEWFLDLCKTSLLDHKTGLPTTSYVRQTVALAHLQLEDTASAKAALIEGIERLPWLYCALFSALNLDTPKSIWGVKPRDDDEELHTRLYVHMTKDLWSNPQAISLLTEAANTAEKVNPATLPGGPEVSLGTARFIYLENNPEMMSAVPRGMLHHASPNFDFDPLPPARSDNKFSNPIQELPWSPSTSSVSGLDSITNEQAQGILANLAAARQGGAPDADIMAHLETLRRETEEAAVPIDRRGFLGRVLDLMMPHIAGGGDRAGDDHDDDGEDSDEEDMPPEWMELLTELDDGHRFTMPGGWGDDDYDPWLDDEFEGEDDFGGRDTDDDLPDLEDIPPPRSTTATRHARVDDADEDSDELPELEDIRPPPGERPW